ncbi:hypothetical protein ACLI08_16190 [Flavobacterium sp. RNTU_13]|uniref:hypothetical protein n=1 Tax=Flavobacterium sp. RNTU_13 TaxID=3375145 RepID=UPI0039881239
MLLQRLFGIKRITVIGVYKDADQNSFLFTALTVEKKKEELTIVKRNSFTRIEDLALIDKDPVILVFDGKGVLNKKIDYKNEEDVAWKKNLDFNTIYYTAYNTDSTSFISFTRKPFADEILTVLKQNKTEIIDFYVGPLTAVVLKPFIDAPYLVSYKTRLEYDTTGLAGIEKVTQDSPADKYSIGNTVVSAAELPLYAAATNFYINNEGFEKSVLAEININEVLYKRAFNVLGVTMLVAMLLLLMVSYGTIQYLLSENAALKQENLYASHTVSEIQKLKSDMDKKMKILENTGRISKNFMSFYASCLGSSVTSGISFSEMQIAPVNGEIKGEKKIDINAKVILVSGTCISDENLDEWLKVLKKIDWIRTVEILSITKNKEGRHEFELKIILNDF